MTRRNCFKAVLAAGAGAASMRAVGSARPIRLDVDLAVDAAKEKEILHNFTTISALRPSSTRDTSM